MVHDLTLTENVKRHFCLQTYRCSVFKWHTLYLMQLILSDIENHRRLVNELTERVANLEALCDNPEVTASLEDVQSRYNDVLYKAKVGCLIFMCIFHSPREAMCNSAAVCKRSYCVFTCQHAW